jgi:class 3 adenylate cyclase
MISTSKEVFLNSELYLKSNSLSIDNPIPPRGLRELLIANSEVHRITIHVSNYLLRNGGMTQAIEVGLRDDLDLEVKKNLAWDFIIFSSLLVIGIYHMILYIQRSNDRSSLYFAIVCVTLSFRQFLTGNDNIHEFVSNASWYWATVVGHQFYFLSVVFFLSYVKSIFKIPFLKLHYSFQILFLTSALVSFLIDLTTLNTITKFSFYILPLVFINILYIIFLNIKTSQGKIFLVSFLIFLGCALNDMMVFLKIIDSIFLGSTGFLIFFMGQASLLSSLFSKAFKENAAMKTVLQLKVNELNDVNSTLSKFVPEDFLNELGKSNITEFELGDAMERDFTILFSDMRSFSTLAEGMTPPELIAFINTYLSTVVPLIHKNNGFVITYLGDAIMAAFPQKPSDALRAAIGMIEALNGLNEQRFKAKQHQIKIGIGINSGTSMIGIIGDQGRMEPTIMSDVVNLAARMESLTKQYGLNIVFSKATFDRLTEEEKIEFQYRKIDEVRVIGKKVSVSLFELVQTGWNEYTDLKIKFKSKYEEAYEYYQKGMINKAYILFKYLYRKNPMDKACSVLIQRCEVLLERVGKGKYRTKPLPANWDYVHNLDRK